MHKSLVISLMFALSALAASVAFADEMETQTKAKEGAPAPADPAKPAVAAAIKPSAADHALRAKIRAKAPFWIDDSAHGEAIRLNKDGSFTSEAQGGGSTAGQWKALGGEVHIHWSDGGEKYSYPVAFKGKELLIRGEKAQKNRYELK